MCIYMYILVVSIYLYMNGERSLISSGRLNISDTLSVRSPSQAHRCISEAYIAAPLSRATLLMKLTLTPYRGGRDTVSWWCEQLLAWLTIQFWGGTSWPLPSLYWRKHSRLKILMTNLIGGNSTYIPPPDSSAVLLSNIIAVLGLISS